MSATLDDNLARSGFLDILDRHGLTEERVAKEIKKLLKAKEIRVFNGRDGIVYSKSLIAWGPRMKGLELLIQARGLRAPEKIEHSGLEGLAERLLEARKRAAASDKK